MQRENDPRRGLRCVAIEIPRRHAVVDVESFDGVTEECEVGFGLGFSGLFLVVFEFGDDDGGQNAEDGDDNHQFNQGEA